MFGTPSKALLKLGVPQTVNKPDRIALIQDTAACAAEGTNRRGWPNPYMDQILNQLGGLVLGSVPTMVLFILLVVAYGVLVRRPLERVLAERRARTIGAVEQAKGAIAAAEAETSSYEEKLRRAQLEIYEARELKLKQWNAEREAALEQVRQTTQERIRTARQGIEESVVDARTQIESVSGELSSRVLSAVLPAEFAATEATR